MSGLLSRSWARRSTTARAIVERLAAELLANPLIEVHAIELLGASSSATGAGVGIA